MLGGREDRVGGLEVVALEAAHARLGDAATQIDILARALGNSAPARIARDVDHRCEGPVYAFGRSFGGRNSRCLFNGLQVPTRRLAARDGKDGAVAVDPVIAEEQGEFQPRLQTGKGSRWERDVPNVWSCV